MAVHLISYTTTSGEQGVARIRTTRPAPSWADCHRQIDGYLTGTYLGVEPEYTLTYTTADGDQRRVLPRTGVESFGKLLSSLAGRGEAWDIAVTDEAGADVVCNFRCFAG